MIAVMLIGGLALLIAICVADLIAPSSRTTVDMLDLVPRLVKSRNKA
jgi:hypothetical protein